MIYTIYADNQAVATMEGDFKRAESPILLDGNSTPYNVGDFSHRKKVAAEMILLWESYTKGSSRVSIHTDDDGERFVLADITVVEGV